MRKTLGIGSGGTGFPSRHDIHSDTGTPSAPSGPDTSSDAQRAA